MKTSKKTTTVLFKKSNNVKGKDQEIFNFESAITEVDQLHAEEEEEEEEETAEQQQTAAAFTQRCPGQSLPGRVKLERTAPTRRFVRSRSFHSSVFVSLRVRSGCRASPSFMLSSRPSWRR